MSTTNIKIGDLYQYRNQYRKAEDCIVRITGIKNEFQVVRTQVENGKNQVVLEDISLIQYEDIEKFCEGELESDVFLSVYDKYVKDEGLTLKVGDAIMQPGLEGAVYYVHPDGRLYKSKPELAEAEYASQDECDEQHCSECKCSEEACDEESECEEDPQYSPDLLTDEDLKELLVEWYKSLESVESIPTSEESPEEPQEDTEEQANEVTVRLIFN